MGKDTQLNGVGLKRLLRRQRNQRRGAHLRRGGSFNSTPRPKRIAPVFVNNHPNDTI